jgi:hypothetical protein
VVIPKQLRPWRVLAVSAILALTAGLAVYFFWGTRKGSAQEDIEEINGAGPLLVVHHVRDGHFVDRDMFGQDVGLEGAALRELGLPDDVKTS